MAAKLYYLIGCKRGRLAQLVRAPALQAGGRRFESCTAHQNCIPHKNWNLSSRLVDRQVQLLLFIFRAIQSPLGTSTTDVRVPERHFAQETGERNDEVPRSPGEYWPD